MKLKTKRHDKHVQGELYRLAKIISLLVLFSVAILILRSIGFGLSYQDSTSMPEGWYLTYPIVSLKKGDIVIFEPPKVLDQFMIKRHWIDKGMNMLKPIRAMAGDRVCIKHHHLFINEMRVAPVFKEDTHGKPLPHLTLCEILKPGAFLLISTKIPNSFDSRYFGPVPRSRLIAKAVKL